MPAEKKIKLVSKLDSSVNWILPNGQETRYVRRSADYFIVYLSSHNGCNMSCRFCHLTQNGQTSFKEATVSDLIAQAKIVIDHYKRQVAEELETPVSKIYFNWMAKGEPLASSTLKIHWNKITDRLEDLAFGAGISEVKFKISTIMPVNQGLEDTTNNKLIWFFNTKLKPIFYYSLYSVSTEFRKSWIPKAISPADALQVLADWQKHTGGQVVLHWAFIKGKNDSQQDIEDILVAVRKSGIVAKFNLVRYNPFDDTKSEETEIDAANANFRLIASHMLLEGSRVIPRVGIDVKGSCGMFFKGK